MVRATLAHAKAHLSELLDKVENGEPLVITRHGRPVANVSAAAPPKQPLRYLAAFSAERTGWRKSSADLLREMRDESLQRSTFAPMGALTPYRSPEASRFPLRGKMGSRAQPSSSAPKGEATRASER